MVLSIGSITSDNRQKRPLVALFLFLVAACILYTEDTITDDYNYHSSSNNSDNNVVISDQVQYNHDRQSIVEGRRQMYLNDPNEWDVTPHAERKTRLYEFASSSKSPSSIIAAAKDDELSTTDRSLAQDQDTANIRQGESNSRLNTYTSTTISKKLPWLIGMISYIVFLIYAVYTHSRSTAEISEAREEFPLAPTMEIIVCTNSKEVLEGNKKSKMKMMRRGSFTSSRRGSFTEAIGNSFTAGKSNRSSDVGSSFTTEGTGKTGGTNGSSVGSSFISKDTSKRSLSKDISKSILSKDSSKSSLTRGEGNGSVRSSITSKDTSKMSVRSSITSRDTSKMSIRSSITSGVSSKMSIRSSMTSAATSKMSSTDGNRYGSVGSSFTSKATVKMGNAGGSTKEEDANHPNVGPRPVFRRPSVAEEGLAVVQEDDDGEREEGGHGDIV